MNNQPNEWIEETDPLDSEESYPVSEYDITASPNDFNIITLFNYMESGIIRIPIFQRGYVWDIRRASKLIESLLLGLPVPQIFLYSSGKNRLDVIDGQQRLLSIYYFLLKRFPRKEKRIVLRGILDKEGKIPPKILNDSKYFREFKLVLKSIDNQTRNKFNNLNYETLDEDKFTLDLRTIRSVVIKQNSPTGNSSMFEIFNRLNTGGVNLKAQEIRASLYHSDFYVSLYKLNLEEKWRKFLGQPEPDLNMRDIEIILRAFALLTNSASYKPSMSRFLNEYSHRAKSYSDSEINYLADLFKSFLEISNELPENIFINERKRFSIVRFEAVYFGVCHGAYKKHSIQINKPEEYENKIGDLYAKPDFRTASLEKTASKANVGIRLDLAKKVFYEQ